MDAIDRNALERPAHEDPPSVDMIVGPSMVSDNRRFGELLARLRQHAGLSRADAAATLRVSAEYLRLIEAGRRTPALGQMHSVLAAYSADGVVGRLMPGGDRPDLVVVDPLDGEPVIVEFTSRIREARRSELDSPAVADRQDEQGSQKGAQRAPSASRAAELGLVVSLLARADGSTIREVRDFLQDKVGNCAYAESQ
jgi:transcriptional regulator with XRE-family HTH domain